MRLPKPAKHWTPRYIADRLRLSIWQRRHAQAPWLVPEAVHFLEQWLRPTDVVVEFGSGRSTSWFAAKTAQVRSVDHDATWYERVRTTLARQGHKNVQTFCVTGSAEDYIGAAATALDAQPNLVLVDGVHRDACALWAATHVAPNGLVVVDNINWFLPGSSRSPSSVSRAITASWETFAERTRAWRQVRFSSGVTDTLLLFAPAERRP